MTTYLTRRVTFDAAHRYWRSDWSDDENRRVFGTCKRKRATASPVTAVRLAEDETISATHRPGEGDRHAR
jgi:hypothetical protein